MRTFKLISIFLIALLAFDVSAAQSRGGFSGGGRSSSGGGGSRGGFSGGSRSSSKPSIAPSTSRASSWGSGSKSKSSAPPSKAPSVSSGSSSSSRGGFSSGSSSKASAPKPSTSSRGGFSSGSSASAPPPSSSSRSNSWGSSQRAPSSAPTSGADKVFAEKAKASGTSYQSRGQAEDAFKKQYSSTYTTKFSSEPTARPNYVPNTYVYNNQSYNVIYDRSYGGYGYYVGSRWYYYDAFTDAVILSSLMNRHNYHYTGHAPPGSTVYVSDGGSAGWVIGGILLGLLLIFVFVIAISQNRG